MRGICVGTSKKVKNIKNGNQLPNTFEIKTTFHNMLKDRKKRKSHKILEPPIHWNNA